MTLFITLKIENKDDFDSYSGTNLKTSSNIVDIPILLTQKLFLLLIVSNCNMVNSN